MRSYARSHRGFILAGFLILTTVACKDPAPVVGALGTHDVAFSGAHVTFSGTSPQAVRDGETFSVTVTPDAGYSLDTEVGGTCAAGSWNGDVYTTGAVRSSCTLTFAATEIEILYTLTAQSGANGAIAPAGTFTVASGASQVFTATPDVGHLVDQWLVDGSLAQAGGTTYELTNITASHTVQVTFGAATLSSSVSSMALAINCQPASSCSTTQNAALTGNPRNIIFSNTGTVAATNVAVNASGLPSGTSLTTNTCAGTLGAGASCAVSLTPGSLASSDAGTTACTTGTEPVAGTVTVTADGGLSTQVSVYVLSYGCQYQGGFIYAVDDTTPSSGSVGGKVASLQDLAAPFLSGGPQSTSVIWSSNGLGGSGGDNSYDIIPLISEINTSSDSYAQSQTSFDTFYSNTNTSPFPSQSAFASCAGSSDGACNTSNILALYNTYTTQFGVGALPYTLAPGPTSPSFYAAGVCSSTINGYSDWYLPAICELDAVDTNVACPSDAQSMNGNLSFLVGDSASITPSTSCSPPVGADCLAGVYWSSTQYSSSPLIYGWGALLSSSNGGQLSAAKNSRLGARCARALTP